MHESLLEVLAEPGTRARLKLEEPVTEGDTIVSGSLVSEVTGRRYPIVRGIPRFVEGSVYADSFGMQWNRFRGVQLDSNTARSHSRERFDAEAGWQEAALRGRWVLDAGCGAGRFAEIAASRGARLVALDYSSAIDASAKTLARFENVDLVQGNLLDPPFREGAFDFSYCIGVVQHTPDPLRVIAQVVSCVRRGGQYCFTIYGRRPWTKLNAKYLVRPLTRRLPKQLLLRAIETAMPVIFPLTDRVFRLPVVGKVARFVIPVATYVDRDEWTEQQRLDEAILDTFDMLSPAYDQPLTPAEVEDALLGAGAATLTFRSRFPVVVVGER